MLAVYIEYARRVHSAEIAAIEARSFTISRSLLEDVARSRSRDSGVRLVAVDERRVVGFVTSSWLFVQPALWHGFRVRDLSINALAVDEPFRRRGIGCRLLTALLERGGARGAQGYLLMVQAENSGAITLYESLGFEFSDRAVDAYGQGLDGLVMKRPATPGDRGFR